MTIAVVSNTVRSAVDALVLEGDIASELLRVPRSKPAPVVIENLPPFVGTYLGGATEPRRYVEVSGDRLRVTQSNGVVEALLPVGTNTFVRDPEPYPLDRYRFHLIDGRVVGLSAYYNGFHGAFYRRLPP